jgi:hypothetical protein
LKRILKSVFIIAIVAVAMIGVMVPSAFADETKIIIDTNPDLTYGGEFSLASSSDFPVAVIIEGDLQEKGRIQLSITGMFHISVPMTYDQNARISDGIPKHLFDLDYKFQEDESYTLIATNGDAQTTIEWIPLPSYTDSEVVLDPVEGNTDDFRALSGEEKEYAESMNILGKVIRIFDDKICVEEYCKEGNTLPVHMEGNIGINTKNSIKLQITHCDKNYWGYCDDYIGLENVIISEIHAKNRDAGNFYADWIFKKTIAEGLYKIESVVDGNVVGEVGDSMMDIIDGQYNTFILVVSNLTPLQITPITDKNATIFVDIEYETLGGTVHYEICAKDDLKNPSFKISSDAARETIVNEIELKKGECFEGKYTIMAQAPATILVPLGTEKSTSSEELDAVKSELAELRKMLEEKQSVPVVEEQSVPVVEEQSVPVVEEQSVPVVEENGGGCLIATATYGSEMATEVQQLRELRDNTLLNTESGTQFMGMFNDVYYSFSPIIADMERENPLFKEAVKLAITPMISTLSLMENAESESEVLSIGISVIALNLGMYLGVPAIVVVGIRKIK